MKKPHLLLWASLLFALPSTAQTGRLGLGTVSPDPSAKVDITATDGGLLTPRLSAMQRDAIFAPANGLIIFNTDEQCFNFYNDTAGIWQSIDCAPVQTGQAVVDCSQSTVQGTYIQGTQLNSATNTITLKVDVTQAGTYNVVASSTGMAFTASGTFTTTGPQTLVLEGEGTPTASGTSLIIASINGGEPCNVVINVISSIANITSCGTAAANVSPTASVMANVPINGSTIALTGISYTGGTLYTMNAGTVDGINVVTPTSGALNASPAGLTLTLGGTPVMAGSFILPYGINNMTGCSMTIPVTTGSGRASAIACTGTLSGTYAANATLTSSNTKVVTLTVSAAGTFYLRTGTVNGVYFDGSATAAGSGALSVTLTGHGTPVVSGISGYTVSVSNGNLTFANCSFDVNYSPGLPPPAPGAALCPASIAGNGSTEQIGANSVAISRTVNGGTVAASPGSSFCGITIGTAAYAGLVLSTKGNNKTMTITYTFSRPVSNIQFNCVNWGSKESLSYATSLSGINVTPTVTLTPAGSCNGIFDVTGAQVKISQNNVMKKANVTNVGGVWYDKISITYTIGVTDHIRLGMMLCNAASL